MPLQNRVTPTSEIVDAPFRGMLMGNRGGALHDAEKRLGARRWVSRQWICCLTSFRGRQRKPMTPGRYTELFFLDEATAFAAGHRPCFECRRRDAARFASLWATSRGELSRARADSIDAILHDERLTASRTKRTHAIGIDNVPDGAMVLPAPDAKPLLVLGDRVLQWTFGGYAPPIPRPRHIEVLALTPPGIMGVLKLGYRPILHETARDQG